MCKAVNGKLLHDAGTSLALCDSLRGVGLGDWWEGGSEGRGDRQTDRQTDTHTQVVQAEDNTHTHTHTHTLELYKQKSTPHCKVIILRL